MQPIAARMICEGVTTVGRDPASDWVIPDEHCEISRQHLDLQVRAGRLLLKPLGANGVYGASEGQRLPNGEEISLAVGDRFLFGNYSVLVERTPLAAESADAATRTMIASVPFGDSAKIPDQWEDDAPVPAPTGQGTLLEAFCEGAKLDPSALAAEDPHEVMRRAGAAYRQTVLGLAALMGERTAVRSRYRFERTTIGSQDNNPFKWAPHQRLGIDLLVGRDSGFLSGEAAIRNSFAELKKHLISTVVGFQATLRALLGCIDPDRIQDETQKQRFLQSRDSVCWIAFREAYGAAKRQLLEDEEGPLNEAFLQAYETRMEQFGREDLR